MVDVVGTLDSLVNVRAFLQICTITVLKSLHAPLKPYTLLRTKDIAGKVAAQITLLANLYNYHMMGKFLLQRHQKDSFVPKTEVAVGITDKN